MMAATSLLVFARSVLHAYPRLTSPTASLPVSGRGPASAPEYRPFSSGRNRSARDRTFRAVAPGRTGARLPEYAVEHRAVLAPLASALTIIGQEQLDLLPDRIGELYSSEDDVSYGRYLPPGTT
jgi:hypothetical protein